MVVYRVVKEYYSREEINILKNKKTNLNFNNKDRWKFHFKDNENFNKKLEEKIDSRIPARKITSNPFIPNGYEGDLK